MAVTVNSVIKDIFSLWGIENPDASVQDARNRAISDLNKSVQMLWQNPEKLGYFNRLTAPFTVTAMAASFDASGIQNIVGPVRIVDDGTPLIAIRTKNEFKNFSKLYFGEDTLADGPPRYYYVDEQGVQDAADSLVPTVYVTPTPLVDTDLEVDWIPNAPAYTWTDYCAEGGTPIPVPHAYGESILLPLARKAAMSYFLFLKPERATMIESEYLLARNMLGLAAPEIEETKPTTDTITEAPWAQRRQR